MIIDNLDLIKIDKLTLIKMSFNDNLRIKTLLPCGFEVNRLLEISN